MPPDLKFFNMAHVDIAGKDVIALRHGMAGQPGYELFGPWADYAAVHAALVEAGKNDGLTLVGGRAYSSNTLESGWLPSPLPAFFTGDSQMMKDLPRLGSAQTRYAGMCSIGGSYVPDSIEGYYLTPWDIGYGHIVKFDHDFVGREALENDGHRDPQAEGHAGARQRRHAARAVVALCRGRPGEVLRIPQRGLCDAPVRRGAECRRQADRRLDLGWLFRPTKARC